MSRNYEDISGRSFGRLTVIKCAGSRHGHTLWLCQCACGNLHIAQKAPLLSGNTKGCGCGRSRKGVPNRKNTYHGLSYHPAYNSHAAMMRRCYKANSQDFAGYGARGIKVCEEWHDIRKFVEWADSNGHRAGLTIERINCNGNYEPSNCCWIPMGQQALNTRRNIKNKLQGEKRESC